MQFMQGTQAFQLKIHTPLIVNIKTLAHGECSFHRKSTAPGRWREYRGRGGMHFTWNSQMREQSAVWAIGQNQSLKYQNNWSKFHIRDVFRKTSLKLRSIHFVLEPVISMNCLLPKVDSDWKISLKPPAHIHSLTGALIILFGYKLNSWHGCIIKQVNWACMSSSPTRACFPIYRHVFVLFLLFIYLWLLGFSNNCLLTKHPSLFNLQHMLIFVNVTMSHLKLRVTQSSFKTPLLRNVTIKRDKIEVYLLVQNYNE